MHSSAIMNVKIPCVGCRFLINPPDMTRTLPVQGVLGHYIDRCIMYMCTHTHKERNVKWAYNLKVVHDSVDLHCFQVLVNRSNWRVYLEKGYRQAKVQYSGMVKGSLMQWWSTELCSRVCAGAVLKIYRTTRFGCAPGNTCQGIWFVNWQFL